MAILAKYGVKPLFFRKRAFWGPFCQILSSPRGGFYINPSRRGPVPGFGAVLGSWSGEARGGPFRAIFLEIPQNGEFGVWAPEGLDLPAPGAGPRREGLM